MIYIVIVLVVFIAAWTGYEIGSAPLVEDTNEYGEPNDDTQEVEDLYFNDPAPPIIKMAIKKVSYVKDSEGNIKEIHTETELHPRQRKAIMDAAEPMLEELVRAEELKRTNDRVF